MSKVCIFLADGFEEIEALTQVDFLRRAGIDAVSVSVTGEKTVTGNHRISVIADTLFEEMNFDDVDMLVLPGGMPGTINLEKHEGLRSLIEKFNEGGKKLAAICAAPSVYGHMGLLEGRKALCYSGFEAELKGAEIAEGRVVTDGAFTTSKGPGTAVDFALELIKVLEGEDASNKVKEAILY